MAQCERCDAERGLLWFLHKCDPLALAIKTEQAKMERFLENNAAPAKERVVYRPAPTPPGRISQRARASSSSVSWSQPGSRQDWPAIHTRHHDDGFWAAGYLAGTLASDSSPPSCESHAHHDSSSSSSDSDCGSSSYDSGSSDCGSSNDSGGGGDCGGSSGGD